MDSLDLEYEESAVRSPIRYLLFALKIAKVWKKKRFKTAFFSNQVRFAGSRRLLPKRRERKCRAWQVQARCYFFKQSPPWPDFGSQS